MAGLMDRLTKERKQELREAAHRVPTAQDGTAAAKFAAAKVKAGQWHHLTAVAFIMRHYPKIRNTVDCFRWSVGLLSDYLWDRPTQIADLSNRIATLDRWARKARAKGDRNLASRYWLQANRLSDEVAALKRESTSAHDERDDEIVEALRTEPRR